MRGKRSSQKESPEPSRAQKNPGISNGPILLPLIVAVSLSVRNWETPPSVAEDLENPQWASSRGERVFLRVSFSGIGASQNPTTNFWRWDFPTHLRLASKALSPCLSLPSASITGMHCYLLLVIVILIRHLDLELNCCALKPESLGLTLNPTV